MFIKEFLTRSRCFYPKVTVGSICIGTGSLLAMNKRNDPLFKENLIMESKRIHSFKEYSNVMQHIVNKYNIIIEKRQTIKDDCWSELDDPFIIHDLWRVYVWQESKLKDYIDAVHYLIKNNRPHPNIMINEGDLSYFISHMKSGKNVTYLSSKLEIDEKMLDKLGILHIIEPEHMYVCQLFIDVSKIVERSCYICDKDNRPISEYDVFPKQSSKRLAVLLYILICIHNESVKLMISKDMLYIIRRDDLIDRIDSTRDPIYCSIKSIITYVSWEILTTLDHYVNIGYINKELYKDMVSKIQRCVSEIHENCSIKNPISNDCR